MFRLAALAPALVAALLAATPARGQEAAFVVAGLSIASNRSVQGELKATEGQSRALEALAALVKERLMTGLGEPGEEQEPGRFRAMIGRADAELHAALGQVLDSGQVARFDQLAIRAAGLDAFSTARVREVLKLTGEQEGVTGGGFWRFHRFRESTPRLTRACVRREPRLQNL